MKQPLTPAQRLQIDELAELRRQLDEIAPVRRRAEELAAIVQTFLPAGADPEATYLLEGDRYTVQAYPRQEQRRIHDLRGLFKFFGQSKFLTLATIPFKLLDALMSGDEQAKYVTKERTGHRTLKLIAKSAAEVKSAQKRAA